MAANAGEARGRVTIDDQASKTLDSLGKKLATVFSVKLFADFVKASLQAQGEQEAAINKLNLALANQGKLTEQTSKSLQNYASELQSASTFSDDMVLANEAMLASFGMSEDQIKRSTQAAADFAAATGGELSQATMLLGKAFAGNTAALGRYGIQVSDTGTKQQKFEQALKAIEQRFGGSALTATKTFAGQMAQLKNSFNDAQEGVGKFIGEMINFESVGGETMSVLSAIGSFFGDTLVRALYDARAAFAQFLAFAFQAAAKVYDLLAKIGEKLGQKDFAADAASRSKIFSDMAAGQEELANELLLAGDAAAKTTGHLQTYTNAVGGTAQASDEAAKKIKDYIDSLREGPKQIALIQKAFASLGKSATLGDVEKMVSDLEQLGPAGESAALQIAGAFAQAGGSVAPLEAMITSTQNELIDFYDETSVAAAAMMGMSNEAFRGFMELPIDESLFELPPTLDEITNSMADLYNETAPAMAAMLGLSEAAYKMLTGGDPTEHMGENMAEAAERAEALEGALKGVSMLANTIGGSFGEMLGVVENIAKSFEGFAGKSGIGKFNAIAGAFGMIGGQIGGKAGGALQGAAGGAMTGAAIGSILPGIGTVIGGVIGGVGGLISGLFGGGKKKAAELKKKKDEAIAAFASLFDEWKSARTELAGKGAEGLNSLVGALFDENGKFNSALTSAANAAEYTAATFAMLRQSGMTTAQALEAIKPALDAMKKDPSKFGGTAAAPLIQMAQAAEANQALLTFVGGLGMTAQALAGFNMLTQDMATRISVDMGASIDKLAASIQSKGVPALDAYNQALALSAQDLYNLQQAAEQSGTTLDAHTQKLIDDAEHAGLFEGLEDPMKKLVELNGAMVSAMGELVKLMGGQLPAAIQKLVDEFNSAQISAPSAPAAPAGFAAGEPAPGTGIPKFASGSFGFQDFGKGTLAMLHGKEAVIRQDDFDSSWLKGGDSSVTMPPVNIVVNESKDPRRTAELLNEALERQFFPRLESTLRKRMR